jgi:hypothetical protein
MALSDEPRYREVVQRLFVRSQLMLSPAGRASPEYAWATTIDVLATEPLSDWPRDLTLPREFGGILRYENRRGRLTAAGPLPETSVAEVHRRIAAAARQYPHEKAEIDGVAAAFAKLVPRSRKALAIDSANLPEGLRERVEIDPEAFAYMAHSTRPPALRCARWRQPTWTSRSRSARSSNCRRRGRPRRT